MIDDPILLVEDNPDDLELMQLALRRAQIRNRIHAVTTGSEAVCYLKGEGRFADRQQFPLPFLLLLDLKLPEIGGLEVLKWIRQESGLHVIVVILSSSAQPRDVVLAARQHCNSYLVKPDSLLGLYELAQVIRSYWIERNQWLPRAS